MILRVRRGRRGFSGAFVRATTSLRFCLYYTIYYFLTCVVRCHGMESSIWQETLWNKICNIIVVNADGTRLTFWQETFRIVLNIMLKEPKLLDV